MQFSEEESVGSGKVCDTLDTYFRSGVLVVVTLFILVENHSAGEYHTYSIYMHTQMKCRYLLLPYVFQSMISIGRMNGWPLFSF